MVGTEGLPAVYAALYPERDWGRREDALFQKALLRKLLLYAVFQEFGVDASGEAVETGKFGKPCFARLPIQYNGTHCKGLVCCAVGREPLGLDAEPLSRPFDWRTAERACTERELEALRKSETPSEEFLRYWTLKESYLKLTGEGLTGGLKNAEFFFHAGRPRMADPAVRASQAVVDSRYLVALCSREREWDLTVKIIPLEKL